MRMKNKNVQNKKLSNINRTLLELELGILFLGIICELIGMFFAPNIIYYTVCLWFGVLMAAVSGLHMYHTMNFALDREGEARKIVTTRSTIRYGLIIIIFGIIMITNIMNPLLVFLGVMTLKVAAYIQPITHKLCNKAFHETDPIPQPMPEEELEEEEDVL